MGEFEKSTAAKTAIVKIPYNFISRRNYYFLPSSGDLYF